MEDNQNQVQYAWLPQKQINYWYKVYYPSKMEEVVQEQTESEISKKFKSAVENVSISQNRCQCKKSLCLKLYCECFNNNQVQQLYIYNQVCSTLCGCRDCGNRLDNQKERGKAIQEALQRNLDAFEEPYTKSLNELPTKRELVPPHVKTVNKGCTCKKTACKKKYCDCFSSGNKCLPTCKCLNCTNNNTNTDTQRKRVRN